MFEGQATFEFDLFFACGGAPPAEAREHIVAVSILVTHASQVKA